MVHDSWCRLDLASLSNGIPDRWFEVSLNALVCFISMGFKGCLFWAFTQEIVITVKKSESLHSSSIHSYKLCNLPNPSCRRSSVDNSSDHNGYLPDSDSRRTSIASCNGGSRRTSYMSCNGGSFMAQLDTQIPFYEKDQSGSDADAENPEDPDAMDENVSFYCFSLVFVLKTYTKCITL